MSELKLSQDFPIRSKSEDLLGRNKFAKDLSKAIDGYDLKECLTIGLFGEWGSGKSSLINLIKEELKSNNEIETIKFEPWLISDLESLIPEYLNLLEKAIAKKEGTFSDVGNKISKYKKAFIMKHGKNILSGININFSLFGCGFNIDVGKILDKYDKSLSEYKEDVVDSLRKCDKKIVVFIDDIDRLDKEEIKTVFKLIKSVADFPKIVYVLAFDREMVARVLDDVQKGYGDKYMQKIVQVSYTVPEPSKDQIINMLKSEINKFVETIPSDYFNKGYFDGTYKKGLEGYITNIRDVKRILNAFKLKYSAIGKECSITDLLAITVLEIFEPEVIKEIWNNRDHVIKRTSHIEEEAKKEIIERIYNKGKGDDVFLKEILKQILPMLEDIKLSTSGNLYRLCNSESFDKYFALSIGKDGLSRYQVKDILELESLEEMKKSLREIQDKNLLDAFLKEGSNYSIRNYKKIKLENKKKIINALSKMDKTGSILNMFKFLNTILKNEIENKKNILDIINDEKNNIFMIIHISNLFGFPKRDSEIKKAVLDRIIEESNKEKFIYQSGISRILDKWILLDNDSYLNYMQNDENKKEFLHKIVYFGVFNRGCSESDYYVRIGQLFSIFGFEKLQTLLNEGKIISHLKEFDKNQKNELIALKLALNSCEKDTTSIEPIRIPKEAVKKELERLFC